jgi:Domain of unknown function (DUF4166)
VRGHGVLKVGHGDRRAARVFAGLLRLPPAGDAVDTTLVVTPTPGGEHWLRTFGTRVLSTRQYPLEGGDIAERFGPLELRFRRELSGGGTVYRQIGTALVLGPARIPLPGWCAPRVTAREDPAGDRRIRIDVRVEMPVVGPILTYAGTIDMDEVSERAQRGEQSAGTIDMDEVSERAQRGEPRERSAPAKRRASERAGESEGRSPSDKK